MESITQDHILRDLRLTACRGHNYSKLKPCHRYNGQWTWTRDAGNNFQDGRRCSGCVIVILDRKKIIDTVQR